MHNGVRVHEFGLRRSDKRLRGSDNCSSQQFLHYIERIAFCRCCCLA